MAIKARGFHMLAVVSSPQAANTLRLKELQWFKVVPSGTPNLSSTYKNGAFGGTFDGTLSQLPQKFFVRHALLRSDCLVVYVHHLK